MSFINNGGLLKIYRGVTIVLLTASVLGIFNMYGAVIRLEEQMSFVKYRLTSIEKHHSSTRAGDVP